MFLFLIAWIWYFKTEMNTAEKFYSQGFEAFKHKDYNKAIKLFLKSITVQPNFKESLLWLGLSYLQIKELDKAKESFEKILKTQPKDFDALFNLAHTLQFQNAFEEAKEIYNKAIKENAKSTDCYFHLGVMTFIEKHYEESLEYFQKAKELSPNNARIAFYIARCKDEICSYDSMEEGQLVIDEYLKVTTHENIPPLFNITLAKAYAKTGQIDHALANCKKALAVNDKDIESYKLLGLLQLLKKDSKEARNALSTAISLERHNAEAHDILSYALCQHDDRTVVQNCRLEYKKIIKKKSRLSNLNSV